MGTDRFDSAPLPKATSRDLEGRLHPAAWNPAATDGAYILLWIGYLAGRPPPLPSFYMNSKEKGPILGLFVSETTD